MEQIWIVLKNFANKNDVQSHVIIKRTPDLHSQCC